MKFSISHHNDNWHVHIAFSLNGFYHCFTRRQIFATRSEAQKFLETCWRARPTYDLIRESSHWFERFGKTVHVEEHWRHPPVRRKNKNISQVQFKRTVLNYKEASNGRV